MNRVWYPVHKEKLLVSFIIRVHFYCLRDVSEAAQRAQISKFSRLQRARIQLHHPVHSDVKATVTVSQIGIDHEWN